MTARPYPQREAPVLSGGFLIVRGVVATRWLLPSCVVEAAGDGGPALLVRFNDG